MLTKTLSHTLHRCPRARVSCKSRRLGTATRVLEGKPNGSPASSEASSELSTFRRPPAFQLTQSPNPTWRTGQGLAEEAVGAAEWEQQGEAGWKTWALDGVQPKDIYPLLTSAIVPRPIALVSSLSSDGVPNLAPFSYFSMVSHDPPLLSVSFSLSPRRPKDTRENILATKEFTVNIISEPFVEAANSTAVEAASEADEWAVSGLTRLDSVDVKPPCVRESAVSFECELYHAHDITPPASSTVTQTLVLGLIKRVHARSAVMSADGRTVDAGRLRAVSRLGGKVYARIGEGFELPRPSWKAIREELKNSGVN
ncbi:hypothetical protein FIBSPDRAFT_956080 [Athelia psychrophila]|uniref:Flavin reductase like domain-containing protein n=1 Tax=Athelia psychrophila TaxID=1759441 RepID=A0A166HCC6_9AGAM|nr:hypothetical protein FIBSPDRAFT_956080 [Fibularhizoctonia sp. CBS 109695]